MTFGLVLRKAYSGLKQDGTFIRLWGWLDIRMGTLVIMVSHFAAGEPTIVDRDEMECALPGTAAIEFVTECEFEGAVPIANITINQFFGVFFAVEIDSGAAVAGSGIYQMGQSSAY